MLVPAKHEKLEKNIIVVGSFIIEQLLKGVELIENILENYLNNNKDTDIDVFYDAMTFLFCVDAIEVSSCTVRLIRK